MIESFQCLGKAVSIADAASSSFAHSRSKAVSPLASRADATYFWCGKSRQNRSCCEGARQTAPGALRCQGTSEHSAWARRVCAGCSVAALASAVWLFQISEPKRSGAPAQARPFGFRRRSRISRVAILGRSDGYCHSDRNTRSAASPTETRSAQSDSEVPLVQAGRAELAPFGRSDMRRVFFRMALCFSAPSRQMGGRRTLGACQRVSSEYSVPPPRRRRRRVSQPRTGVSGSACLSDRRERYPIGVGHRARNRPVVMTIGARNAGNRAEGPAASPGSFSWLLLGAPRSNSPKPAQPAAKPPLMLAGFGSCQFEATSESSVPKSHLIPVEHRSDQLRSTPDRMAPSPMIGGKH